MEQICKTVPQIKDLMLERVALPAGENTELSNGYKGTASEGETPDEGKGEVENVVCNGLESQDTNMNTSDDLTPEFTSKVMLDTGVEQEVEVTTPDSPTKMDTERAVSDDRSSAENMDQDNKSQSSHGMSE